MAKSSINVAAQCSGLLAKIQAGEFSPVYLLMGDEPYYLDLVCNAIIEHSLDEFSRDFNETICYGADVDAETVITAARRFPMMAERQLVVVKEAQQMKGIEDLAVYCNEPLDSTVLVLLLHKASVDRRKGLYKAVQKNGIVLDGFLGSASTLIACDQIDRICFGAEIEEKFVDVAVKRFISAHNGKYDDVYVIRDGQKLKFDEVATFESEERIE